MTAGNPSIPQPDGKRAVFVELLEAGVTSLHIDARSAGVEVPNDLRGRTWLVLNYSYRYQIEDFHHDDALVIASLSFAGNRFPCRVPWSAVFAISDARREEVRVWPEDMPWGLRAALIADSGDQELTSSILRTPNEEPVSQGLRVITGSGSSAAAPKRGHLRRVK